MNGQRDTNHYANQTGTYRAAKDGWVATFAESTGFLDSGMAFTTTKAGKSIAGMALSDPAPIAVMLHKNGYGVGNANYESELTSVIRRVIGSSNCPGK